MRVLIDTNLFINYLLSPSPLTSATGRIFQAANEHRFTLVIAADVVAELDQKVSEDSRLARRIPRSNIDRLVATLGSVAELVPKLPGPYAEIGRDRKDDFLVALTVRSQPDYLVTWDKDLRDLRQINHTRVVSPPELLQLLPSTELD